MSFPRFVDPAHTIVEASAGMQIHLPRFEALYRDDPDGVPEIAPYAPPEKSIEAWRFELNAAVDRHADALRLALVSTDSKTQLEVYRNKYDRAQAGDAAFFTDEAAARKVTPEQLMAIVIQKGDEWRAGGQAIEAAKGAHRTAIAALNLESAEIYDVAVGWPVIPG